MAPATLEEANAELVGGAGSTGGFIKEFNERFGVPAASPELAYRRVPEGFRPEEVFCFKYLRVVAHDNTVGFFGQRLQLLADDRRTSYAKLKVEVHVRLDQSIGVYHDGRLLGSVDAPKEPKELRTRRGPRPSGTGEPKSASVSAVAGSPPETKTESSPSPDLAKAEAKPEERKPDERTPGETHREIDQSNDLSKSDGAAMKGASGPNDEKSDYRSDCRKVIASHIDKWTGERIARPATPSSSHPWRTISQKLKDKQARSS